MSAAFGLFGLLLASVGLYGLVAFFVVKRRHELTIRAALGARALDLRRLVLAEALRPVAGGVLLGLLGALALRPDRGQLHPRGGGLRPRSLRGR